MVTAENIQPLHLRSARALLNLSVREFARYAEAQITFATIRNFEHGRATSVGSRECLIQLIEAAGIELLNDGKPGARIIDQKKADAASAVK